MSSIEQRWLEAYMTGGTVKIGGTPPITVNSGTIQTLNSGSLQYVGNIGTLPNVVVGSGTLQAISNAVTVGSGTIQISDGTLTALPNIIVGSGTLQTLNSGSLQYIGSIGTLPNIIVESGTLQALGSANTYSPHDLHVYDTLGTIMAAVGTLIQTPDKIVKVHQYSIYTDGTLAYTFNDTKPDGGTIDCGAVFHQRTGRDKPFIPYPGYHFKTFTAGSALCLGTYDSGLSGTAYIHMVYTDDDTS